MMSISDIRVETQISFAQHRYIITSVGEGFFIAKRFRDGVERRFEIDDILKTKVVQPKVEPSYVAVDPDGSAYLFPYKPVKGECGQWYCLSEYSGECVNEGVEISWSVMQKLTGKCIMTCMDEPVKVI